MNTLKIGRFTWKVEISDSCEEAESDDLGLCIWDDKLIWVRSTQSERQILITLVHEIFHAMAYSYDLKLGHPVINKLQSPIADLIRKNKLL